jgi:hypothetical protein
MNTCYFCRRNKAIEKSHIIPRYFFKWLKDNSFTGYMRASINKYNRIQDGIKLPLLCSDCEQEFSKYEKYFKEHIFDEIINKHEKILLTSDSKKFIYSLIWRVVAMYYYFKKDYKSNFNENEYSNIPNFLEAIKDAYCKGSSMIIKTHILPINEYTNKKIFIKDQDLFHKILYMQKAIGINFYPWEDERYFIVFIKLPSFVIVCEMNKKNTWRDVQIEYVSEIFLNKEYNLPEYIFWLLRLEYENYCEASNNKMSEKDNAKIMEMISKNTINKKAIALTRELLLNLIENDNKI